MVLVTQRIFWTIHWNACRGGPAPQTTLARHARIRALRGQLISDLRNYDNQGVDISSHRPREFQQWFEDMIRGYSATGRTNSQGRYPSREQGDEISADEEST